MRIAVPESIRRLMAVMETAGFEACAVGGCVRDSLLGNMPNDWDMCTSAFPEATMSLFERTIPTGVKHGTVTVIWEGEPIELTTYRVDGSYTDFRRPDEVTFTRTLEEDLSRRDFTVNAMACRSDGEVIDLFGGQEDLARGSIRCVGDPMRRFREDALRILRGLRFAARLGFSLEPDTAEAALELRNLLKYIAPERIWKELSGLLVGRCAGEICSRYQSILETVLDLPLGNTPIPDTLEKDAAVRLAWLLHHAQSEELPQALAQRIAFGLRTDKKTRLLLETLLVYCAESLPDDLPHARRLVGSIGSEAACKLASLHRHLGTPEEICALLEQVVTENHCVTIGQLAITGEYLRQNGFSAGPKLGKLLHALLDAVMDGEVANEREALLKYAQKTK